MDRRGRLLETIKALVKIPSVTGSGRESEPGLWIKSRLAKLPYFAEHTGHLKWIPTPLEGSAETLCSLVARVDAAKPTDRAILMIGHYDVVDAADYGELAEFAFDPAALAGRMGGGEEDVLYGRGVMDMKCGVAIELDILEEFAGNRDLFDVNIVCAFVGDEENSSAGMRKLLPVLAGMQREGLRFLAAVDTEPGEAGGSGEGPKIFLGTLGKLMPAFYVRGRASHAGDYYGGFSAALAAARIAVCAEGCPSLAEPLNGRAYPSWICLDMKVMRDSYSVTVPDRACVYFNCFTAASSPSSVAAQMRDVAERAMELTAEQLCGSRRLMLEKGLKDCPRGTRAVKTYSFAQLAEKAEKRLGAAFAPALGGFISGLPAGDMRDRGVKIVDKVADMSGEEGPFAVYFFLPPWLPARSDLTGSPRDEAVVEAARETEAELLEKHGVKMEEHELFAGLCDLSYVGAAVSGEDAEVFSGNMPGMGVIYSLDIESMKALGMPVLNIGPSGADAHRKTERLRLRYSLDILPGLLRGALRRISACCAKRGV